MPISEHIRRLNDRPLKMLSAFRAFLWLCFIQLSLSGGEKPNIILLMADDLGFGDVAYNGNTTVHTPHLDTMAA